MSLRDLPCTLNARPCPLRAPCGRLAPVAPSCSPWHRLVALVRPRIAVTHRGSLLRSHAAVTHPGGRRLVAHGCAQPPLIFALPPRSSTAPFPISRSRVASPCLSPPLRAFALPPHALTSPSRSPTGSLHAPRRDFKALTPQHCTAPQ
ncbi:hypothetical protein DENSPDRAFT_886821 [Dentipellis sp. KUC8613]|nr:hypothetical protein DENSPDRAFT_886821 [Dentipellis sp. KUC8613]